MDDKLISFFKKLYNDSLKSNNRIRIIYSKDSYEKHEELKNLKILQDNGYITLPVKALGFCRVEITQYGIHYAKELGL